MKRLFRDKNNIFLIGIVIIFLLSFITYGYSLIKKDDYSHAPKDLVDEPLLEKAEDDPEYASSCLLDITYHEVGPAKAVDGNYEQELLITITNNSEEVYTSWQFKIPTAKISIKNISNASYIEKPKSIYVNNMNQAEYLRPGETYDIEASILMKDRFIDDFFKCLVITGCSNESIIVTESGEAKLAVGPLDQVLEPEITISKVEDNNVTYSVYLNNNSEYDVKNYRLLVSYKEGEYVSSSPLKVTIDSNKHTIFATSIDSSEDVIKKGTKSPKFTFTLTNVPSDYIPNIVAVGQKK